MFSRFTSGAPIPCANCNSKELEILNCAHTESEDEFWVYTVKARTHCPRCSYGTRKQVEERLPYALAATGLTAGIVACCYDRKWLGAGIAASSFVAGVNAVRPGEKFVEIPLPLDVVGQVERSIHSSSTNTTGSAHKAHGNFISLLSTLECSEKYKQSLCTWAPMAMIEYDKETAGVRREMRKGRQGVKIQVPTIEKSEKLNAMALLPPNHDCEDGAMKATQVDEKAYGDEDRVFGVTYKKEPKNLAYAIGPDLIATEVMDNCESNIKSGLCKRVDPLPFQASKDDIRKIDKTVSVIIKEVFPVDKIKQWRVDNPNIDDFKSSKWSTERWRLAVEEALSDVHCRIEQTFQIKSNEALPAKGKAPRPIIQCGDRAQAMMSLPVKCFEDLLFEYFEQASIKHTDKYSAMKRVASHLRQQGANVVEGDGSAWDACCNKKIRDMTENRVLRYIIEVLGQDPEVPKGWLDKVIKDLEKGKIKGKCKVNDDLISPLRVCIEAIRQSGHRGTSCFNFFINLVCWLVVMCDKPEMMIKKNRDGTLRSKYVSPVDGKEYFLKYAFEGDDSALSTTENLQLRSEQIEKQWTSFGFRMKLVYVKDKLTFTGFDHLCDDFGPTGVCIPEVARNIASSSWTTSSEVKKDPTRKHYVGAAAMLARAQNFKDCGPMSAYFAALGLAHVRYSGDRAIGEAEAKALAINVSPSVKDALQECHDSAGVMSKNVRRLFEFTANLSKEEEMKLLRSDFGNNPCDIDKARLLIPFKIWNPANFSSPRR